MEVKHGLLYAEGEGRSRTEISHAAVGSFLGGAYTSRPTPTFALHANQGPLLQAGHEYVTEGFGELIRRIPSRLGYSFSSWRCVPFDDLLETRDGVWKG